ncbi:hypothetical protein PRIPAC_95822 [Pristionchus pacificus]|uniref:EGF-like domain-containing protein n=1 Tax=Pristionchus pacificus TaxID=54126 RepID=A0A2A6BD44_PRIPA|nr:hypothetical protein PRIPAC_95822 [Pristionchus pacificus]|eukprot:PDM63797.1 hypothetical protein PRIPAC_49770 [Pristionchus pacificus]
MEQIFENADRNDPESECSIIRNGGVYLGGRCHCVFPNTGPDCTDFQCVHGMSIGLRFQPKSLLFNKPCICTRGWSGDLCEYHVSEKCNSYGEWKNGHCECIGYHFGPTCQFVSKCVNGLSVRGRCACHENWEGEYCHRIICHHGTSDLKNKSMSCICSKRYTGQYCDACSKQAYDVSPYPECEKVVPRVVPHVPREPKKKVQHAKPARSTVLFIGGIGLIIFMICMFLASFIWNRTQKAKEQKQALEGHLKERTEFLEEAAKEKPEEEESPFALSWRWGGKRMSLRKSSLGNMFRFGTKEARSPLATSTSTNTFEPARILDNRISRIST